MTDSKKLLDYWLPTEGAGQPIGCLASSFTFEVKLFETECLGRFLGLNSRRGEGDDLSFAIEEEERLAETRVSVIIDRSWSAEGHNLRWDVLPVALRRGLQHSKTALLVWEKLVRVIIGSANLTPAGYRRQIETATVLDAIPDGDVPGELFTEFITSVRRLLELAPGDPNRAGPKQRALETISLAERRIRSFKLPSKLPGRLLATVIASEPGRPALAQIDRIWRGGPAESALVVSPFFDASKDRDVATEALVARLKQRGPSKITYIVPVETSSSKMVVRAPKTIASSVPRRVGVEFLTFTQPEGEDLRHLHAKAVLVENDIWTALMTGSSNFTAAGLGLEPKSGHLELNVAFGAPADSREAKHLRQMFERYYGDKIDTNAVAWDPKPDEEDLAPDAVPWGFLECLLEPGSPSRLHFRFDVKLLPESWSIRLPSGPVILTNADLTAEGRPWELSRALPADTHTFLLEVTWTEAGTEKHATWPLNVTEPGRLPPPSELRNLSIDALLEALASTRPIHEAVATALRRQEQRSKQGNQADLDPLKRYSQTGRLLQRARQLAMALEGLRRRLQRPASSLDPLLWRLKGPFGPLAIADGFVKEAQEGRVIPGEPDFVFGEIALTLSRVRWDLSSTLARQASKLVAEILDLLQKMRSTTRSEARLADYVDRAFAEASR